MQLIVSDSLKSAGSDRGDIKQRIVRHCNNEYKTISRWIQKNNGSDEDSKDIFNDAIVILLDKIDSGPLLLNCELSTYFFSICKHLWFHENRRRKRLVLNEEMDFNFPESNYDGYEDEKYAMMIEIMDKLDDRSKEMFRHIFNNRSYAEIAEIMNFKNPQAVADKKKNCIKKIIAEMLSNSKYRDKLNEISELHRIHSV